MLQERLSVASTQLQDVLSLFFHNTDMESYKKHGSQKEDTSCGHFYKHTASGFSKEPPEIVELTQSLGVPLSCRMCLILASANLHKAHHASILVVGIVAVKGPCSRIIRNPVHSERLHRVYQHRVF